MRLGRVIGRMGSSSRIAGITTVLHKPVVIAQIKCSPTLVTNMLRFDLSQLHAGWVQATVSCNSEELTVRASYTPTDAIRDFVDAVASLKSVASAHCCWFQEPGEMHWQFLRSKDRVTVEIIRFAGRHGPDGVSVFKAEAQWVEFAEQVFGSMLTARDSLGVDGYNREWRHPFPKEACDKLDKAIHESKSGGLGRRV